MKKYYKKNRFWYIGSLLTILFSTIFAVILQFFKGDVLDYAIQGAGKKTLRYGALLILFILLEILFYFGYRLFNDFLCILFCGFSFFCLAGFKGRVFCRRFFCCHWNDRSAFLSFDFTGGNHQTITVCSSHLSRDGRISL